MSVFKLYFNLYKVLVCISLICSSSMVLSAKLTLSMVVKNEANRYLRDVLLNVKNIIDNAVIIDDASTDDTLSICYEVLKDVPCTIIHNPTSRFSNEINLRKQQWEETLKTDPEWILNLDADEIFESAFQNKVKDLIAQSDIDVYFFRLYDFWDNEHYREDCYWSAHFTYRPFLMRFKKGFEYKWYDKAQHCGRFPYNITGFSYSLSNLRLKHYGWARKEDRLAKYQRYKDLDPDGIWGNQNQYISILDATPNLIRWVE